MIFVFFLKTSIMISPVSIREYIPINKAIMSICLLLKTKSKTIIDKVNIISLKKVILIILSVLLYKHKIWIIILKTNPAIKAYGKIFKINEGNIKNIKPIINIKKLKIILL